LILVPLLGLGCSGDDDIDDIDDFDDTGAATVGTSDVDDWESSVVFGVTDPFEDPYFSDTGLYLTVTSEPPLGNPSGAAQVVEELSALYFTPGDCVDIVRDGANLSYTFDGCTGRIGNHTLDGQLSVSFVDVPDAIGFNIASDGLQVDGVDAELDANGTYYSHGDVKFVEFISEHTLRGRIPVQGNFNGTLYWVAGSDCLTTNAMGQNKSGDLAVGVDIAGYTRCGQRCPRNGVITANNDETTWTLTFDGSDRASLVSTAGQNSDVALDCSP
jgi:hypothetical protein